MGRTILLLCLVVLTTTSFGQSNEEKALFDQLKSDNSEIVFNTYRDLGYLYENTDTSKAMYYYRKGMEHAVRWNNDAWIASAYIDFGNVQFNSDQPSVARGYFQKARTFAIRSSNASRIGACCNNIANTFLQEFRNDSALHYSFLALKEFESVGDSLKILLVKSNISSYLEDMRQLDACLEYVNECIELGIHLREYDSVVSALVTGAIAKIKKGDKAGAEAYLDKAASFMDRVVNRAMLPQFYQNLGGGYQGIQKYDRALQYADSAIKLVSEFDFVNYKASIFMLKGIVLMETGKFNESEPWLNQALSLALETRDWMVARECYMGLSQIAENQKSYVLALDYYKLYHQYSDSTLNERISEQMVEVNAKYQLDRKQFEIERIQKEGELSHLKEEQQRTTLLTITGVAILIIIVLILLYAIQRRKVITEKQEIALQEARISALEQEKIVVAMDSIIRGEEQERSRVAKDLHDGLGGLLSGVKLSLSSIKGNLIIEENQVRIFERSISQLDEAIHEMRRVAHNMMPESLIKFGLPEAVSSLCQSILDKTSIKVHFSAQQWTGRIAADKEIMAYRIIQELVNNMIKHSAANAVIIQLTLHNDTAHLEVEDDGNGFDMIEWETNSGMGFSNLKSRVDYLKGRIHVHAEKGKGASFVIEFPVKE